jgi:predicted transcriptional regulator
MFSFSRVALLVLAYLNVSVAFAGAKLTVGGTAPVVKLDGKLGGRVDGNPWSSDEIKNKPHLIMYIDPDEKDVNEVMQESLKKQEYGPERLTSVAIMNLGATWKPNAVINAVLKQKQKEFPNTVYVRDLEKTLVKEWGLQDDAYDVVLFNRDGKILFYKDGKLTDSEIQELIKLIWDENKATAPAPSPSGVKSPAK